MTEKAVRFEGPGKVHRTAALAQAASPDYTSDTGISGWSARTTVRAAVADDYKP